MGSYCLYLPSLYCLECKVGRVVNARPLPLSIHTGTWKGAFFTGFGVVPGTVNVGGLNLEARV